MSTTTTLVETQSSIFHDLNKYKSIWDDELDEQLDQHEQQQLQQYEHQAQQYDIVSDSDIESSIIMERNREIRQIAQDMEDLSDITLSLSTIVQEQGEMLDVTEKNIDSAQQATHEAVEHLANAESSFGALKAWAMKGMLVSGGVTGVGALGMILSPIIGGVGIALGVGGLIVCAVALP